MNSIAFAVVATILLPALAAAANTQGDAAPGEPPRIDALSGAGRGWKEFPVDPALWETSAQVAVKGAPHGIKEAKVHLRMQGAGDPRVGYLPMQVVFAFDNSDVMNATDPAGDRCGALSEFANLSLVPSELAAVGFGTRAEVQSNLTPDMAQFRSSVRCEGTGSRDIEQALRVSNGVLLPNLTSGHVWAEVLITSGVPANGTDPFPWVVQLAQQGTKLFTVCVGLGCNYTELQYWAQLTGGRFYPVAVPADLLFVSRQIHSDLTVEVVDYLAGRAPPSGLPMVVYALGGDVEVVPGTFRCISGNCYDARPSAPSSIQDNNRGLALHWMQPLSELLIYDHWEIQFQVRSYKIGVVPLNDPGASGVLYQAANGTELISAPFPQMYLLGTVPTVPQVVATYPEDKAVNVDRSAAVVVTFDQEMDPETTVQSITVSPNAAGETASVWGNQLAWSHSELLARDTVYSVRVLQTAKTPSGVALKDEFLFSFDTGTGKPIDPIKPRVTETRPLDGARSVPVTSSVVVLFDQQMDPQSTSKAFTINPSIAGGKVSVVGNELTMTHSVEFTPQTSYQVEIHTSASNTGGVPMGAAYAFGFKTGGTPPPPPAQSPRVVFDPVDGTTNFSVQGPVYLRFTQKMDTASVTAALRIEPEAKTTVSWHSGDTELMVVPQTGWVSSQKYTITLEATAKSATGTKIAASAQSSFVIAAAAPGDPDEAAAAETMAWILRALAVSVLAICGVYIALRYRRTKAEEARRRKLGEPANLEASDGADERQRPGTAAGRPAIAEAARRLARERLAERVARSSGGRADRLRE